MSNDEINCPHCDHVSEISKLELWEVYEFDGKETDITCSQCDKEFRIISTVDSWIFNTEVIDD